MLKDVFKNRIQEYRCPYCGVERENLAYGNIEINGKEAFQVVDCMNCERHYTDVYSLNRVILTDHPGDDFIINFKEEYVTAHTERRFHHGKERSEGEIHGITGGKLGRSELGRDAQAAGKLGLQDNPSTPRDTGSDLPNTQEVTKQLVR